MIPDTYSDDDVTCIPYGVGHHGEGIALELRLGRHRILLDCGLADISSLATAPDGSSGLDWVVCSHAHDDHSLGLNDFSRRWPQVPIYTSLGTAALLDHVPDDSLQPLAWRTPCRLAEDLILELWPAGHLPGAACILLTYYRQGQSYRIFYTGDCCISNTRLVEGLPLADLRGLSPDILILEGSLGASRYPNRRQQENQLVNQLRSHLATPRCVVFPVPLLGLGQELLMLWRSHYYFTGQPLTIWVDPAIAQGCDAYLELLEQQPDVFPRSVQNFAQHQALFWDRRISPTIQRLATEAIEPPAVLLVHPATPATHYCSSYPGPWSVFLPEGVDLTLWQRQLNRHGPAYDWLDSFKNATASGTLALETYQLHSHCDGSSTTQLIHNLRPRHVLLVHGLLERLSALANLESLQSRYKLHIPLPHHPLTLHLNTQFASPPPPQEATFEGTIGETEEQVTVQLPMTVTQDIRWQHFTETGIVEARWQGDQLVLRGLDPAELMGVSNRLAPDRTVCDNGRFDRQRHCQQPRSPLYGRQVAADGSCPEFKKRPAIP